jgi:hypothetical protein
LRSPFKYLSMPEFLIHRTKTGKDDKLLLLSGVQ